MVRDDVETWGELARMKRDEALSRAIIKRVKRRDFEEFSAIKSK